MRLAFVMAALLAAAVPARAERPYVAIEQRLSAEQLRETGLDRLSPAQLARLNQLLRDDQDAVVAQSVATERTRKAREAEAPVTSTLKGEFRGWQSGTVFELENGQRWRVVDSDYSATRKLHSPAVTVSPGFLGSWFLQVEGVGVKAKVKRIEP